MEVRYFKSKQDEAKYLFQLQNIYRNYTQYNKNNMHNVLQRLCPFPEKVISLKR